MSSAERRITDEQYDAIVQIRRAFADVKNKIEALPVSRMRSLAITDLECSFSRAVFAAADLQNPIDDPIGERG